MVNMNWLWKEWILPFIKAAILAGLIIVFIAQSFKVEGISMENTLFGGERIMVDKLTYRFREPRRGEIIVLKMPDSKLIKRIIAVSGDLIEERRGGVISINGVPQKESYVTNRTNMNWGGPFFCTRGGACVGDGR